MSEDKKKEGSGDSSTEFSFGKFTAKGVLPIALLFLLILLMAVFPERFATVLHGKDFKAGKTGENGLTKKLEIISFWTPSPCISKSADQEDCTHNDLVEFYKENLESCNEQLSQQFRYQVNCKKVKDRILNGYYFITKNHISKLEDKLIRKGAKGYNRFLAVGASSDSPTKSGFWWEVTYEKGKSIDSNELSKMVNGAFGRDGIAANDKCSGLMKAETQEDFSKFKYDWNAHANPLFKDCWDKLRAPYISVYAEIKG